MNNVKKVPEIRFKGFNEEWEEEFLKDNVEFYSGLTYNPSDVSKKSSSSVLVIRSSNIENGKFVLNNDDVYVKEEALNSTITEVNDIVVVVRNGSKPLIGKHGIITKSLRKATVGAFMTGIRAYRFNFINTLLDTHTFKKQIDENMGATINQITNSTFNSMFFYFPNCDEQTQIGNFFKNLDEKLEIEKEKLKKLIDFKKAMLENMFPNTSEKLPKLRFSGFSYEWEYGNLKEFNTKFSDGNYGESYPKNSDFRNKGNGVPFLRGLNLKDGKIIEDNCLFISHQKNDELTSGHLKLDDIVIAVRGSIGALGYVSEKFVENNINSQLAIIRTDKTKINGMYLLSFLLSNIGKNNINSMISGSALKQLPIKNLEKINVVLPTLTEQQQIGEFFQNLDKKIELSKTKIKKIENFKKAMLDKMFV